MGTVKVGVSDGVVITVVGVDTGRVGTCTLVEEGGGGGGEEGGR
jgi:hypothetical protein